MKYLLERLNKHVNLNLTKEDAEKRIFELFDKGEIPEIVSALNQHLKVTNYETRNKLAEVLSERDRLDTIEFLYLCEEESRKHKLEKWLNTEPRITVIP